jgi:hypothetical protein
MRSAVCWKNTRDNETSYFQKSTDVPSGFLHVIVQFTFPDSRGLRVNDNFLDNEAEAWQSGRIIVRFIAILPDCSGVKGVHSIHETDLINKAIEAFNICSSKHHF